MTAALYKSRLPTYQLTAPYKNTQINWQFYFNNYPNTFSVPLQTIGLQLLFNYILNNFHFPHFYN